MRNDDDDDDELGGSHLTQNQQNSTTSASSATAEKMNNPFIIAKLEFRIIKCRRSFVFNPPQLVVC